MRKIDSDYFDTYKKLDSFTQERFDCQEGISDYLSMMDSRKTKGSKLVYSWKEDYSKIKKLRWIRNKIAHEVDAKICTSEDLFQVKIMYERFLSGEDPLTKLWIIEKEDSKKREKKKKKNKSAEPKRRIEKRKTNSSKSTRRKSRKKKSNAKVYFALFLLLLIFAAIAIFYFYLKNNL